MAFWPGRSLTLLVIIWFLGEDWRPLLAAAILVAAGAALAGTRAQMLAEPVLGFRYYGPIEGRIIKIDRSGSDAVRLTLDRVVLKRMDPARTPTQVRVSLHGQQGFITPEPGQVVILTGHLSPPSGPVEPGGFDFQRKAWFAQLGAVGYTRTPVLTWAPAHTDSVALWIYRVRVDISNWVQSAMPGRAGAFAAAVTTGDRSALPRESLDDLRASNLAHLLAISGLHMGLLTGFVFTLARYLMVLMPGVALRWPVKKLAAVLALIAGAGYLALSGGNVATERAFIMVAVMFVAVLLDRRAVTLRAVAVAATIVLVLRPEVLPEPGFQMSFSATTALVAVFGLLRKWPGMGLPKWARPIAAVVISSAVAGTGNGPLCCRPFQSDRRLWTAGQPAKRAPDGANRHARRGTDGLSGTIRPWLGWSGNDAPGNRMDPWRGPLGGRVGWGCYPRRVTPRTGAATYCHRVPMGRFVAGRADHTINRCNTCGDCIYPVGRGRKAYGSDK